MRYARLYLRYVGVSLRGQMQYRLSFVMSALGHLLITGIEIVGIWALFERFGSLREWRLAEVAFFYGLVNTAFALAEAIGRGFDTFPRLVKSGDFDRMLLRPRGAALQVAASELQLMRVGRLAQGLIVLLWAGHHLDVAWTPARLCLAGFAISGGVCLFCGLFVVQAAAAFWSTESLEVFNTVTYGGTETAQYPLSIYRPWFRTFFTYIIPLATVAYFPAVALIGRTDPLGTPLWFQWLSPSIGVMFLACSGLVWKVGVRHYRSTGS